MEREEKFLGRVEKEDVVFEFFLSSNPMNEDEFYKNIAETMLMIYKEESA